MFTRKDQLDRKGGCEERLSFLTKLKDEFTTSKSLEVKEQVLANLANFAYDPINYPFIKELHIVNIFLNELQFPANEQVCAYAVGGLCNVCNDPEFAHHIIAADCISHLSALLSHQNKELALNALTILYYLGGDEQSRHLITTPLIIDKVRRHCCASDDNSIVVDPRLANLACIFLRDLCPCEHETSAAARQIEAEAAKAIPFPPPLAQ